MIERNKYIKYDNRLKKRARKLRFNQTKPEKIIWEKILKNKQFFGYKFTRQKMIEYFIVDFYCSRLKLVIEIDGDSHYTEQGIIYDLERTQILENKGLNIIRYKNNEVLKNIEGIFEDLKKYII